MLLLQIRQAYFFSSYTFQVSDSPENFGSVYKKPRLKGTLLGVLASGVNRVDEGLNEN